MNNSFLTLFGIYFSGFSAMLQFIVFLNKEWSQYFRYYSYSNRKSLVIHLNLRMLALYDHIKNCLFHFHRLGICM